jgi:hypothetical protein
MGALGTLRFDQEVRRGIGWLQRGEEPIPIGWLA